LSPTADEAADAMRNNVARLRAVWVGVCGAERLPDCATEQTAQ